MLRSISASVFLLHAVAQTRCILKLWYLWNTDTKPHDGKSNPTGKRGLTVIASGRTDGAYRFAAIGVISCFKNTEAVK